MFFSAYIGNICQVALDLLTELGVGYGSCSYLCHSCLCRSCSSASMWLEWRLYILICETAESSMVTLKCF